MVAVSAVVWGVVKLGEVDAGLGNCFWRFDAIEDKPYGHASLKGALQGRGASLIIMQPLVRVSGLLCIGDLVHAS